MRKTKKQRNKIYKQTKQGGKRRHKIKQLEQSIVLIAFIDTTISPGWVHNRVQITYDQALLLLIQFLPKLVHQIVLLGGRFLFKVLAP